MNSLTICFCTVVKNRLHHLRKTLPVSIFQNQQENVKFLLLDYNSEDGLEDYIKSNFQAEIGTGKLVYYKNPVPEYFSQSHSRNMAFTLATTDLICNVDADNFVGPGFGKWLCDQFESTENIYFTGIGNLLNVEDVRGKVCLRKTDFLEINGYDESFEGYGYEDYDFVNRLDMKGLKRQNINEASFLLALTHPNAQRLSNEKLRSALHSMYVQYINPDKSAIMLLMNDHTSFDGIVVNNYTSRNTDYPYEDAIAYAFDFKFLMEDGWKKGNWKENSDGVLVTKPGVERVFIKSQIQMQEVLSAEDSPFYKVTTPEMIGEGVMFFMLIRNREKMLANTESKNIVLNKPYGKGTVYKNFNINEPVKL